MIIDAYRYYVYVILLYLLEIHVNKQIILILLNSE